MIIIPTIPLDGKYLVWGNGGYIKKTVQGRIVWRQILEKIKECYPQRTFGWIGCRTQNPLMMRSYGYFGSLYPFETDYSTGEGYRVMNYLLEHIPQVKNVTNLAHDKGICRTLYPTGRLGDYRVNHKGGIEKQLAEWRFNRDNGDALIVIARLPLNVSEDKTSSADFL